MISRKGVTPVEWCKCNQYEIALKPRRVPVISTTILAQFLQINKKTTILNIPYLDIPNFSHLSTSGGPAWSARQPHQRPRREVLGLPCWQVSSSSANDESLVTWGTKISKFLLCVGEFKSMDYLNWYCDEQKSCQVLEGACWGQLRPAGSPLPDGGEEALFVFTPHRGTRLAGNM